MVRSLSTALAAILFATTALAQVQPNPGGGGSATPGTGTGLLVGQTSPSIASPTITGTETNNGTIIGTAFSNYLASPPNIGATAQAQANFSVSRFSYLNTNGTSFPVIAASIGGSTCALAVAGTCTYNQTASTLGFKVLTASAVGATSITVTVPNLTAQSMVICIGFDATTPANWLHQTSGTTTTATMTFYNSAGTATAMTNAVDSIYMTCFSE